MLELVSEYLGVDLKWNMGSNGQLKGVNQHSIYMTIPCYVVLDWTHPSQHEAQWCLFSVVNVEEDKSPHEVHLYQQMFGSLLCLALQTFLYISAPVPISGNFQKAPNRYARRGVERVSRYLRGTINHFLVHHPQGMLLNGYVDSDYAVGTTDRDSQSGYTVKRGSCSRFYAARKQASVPLSTSALEHYAPFFPYSAPLWLSLVLEECGTPTITGTLQSSDDECAIDRDVGERCPFGCAKHIDAKMDFIRDLVRPGFISVQYVTSEDNDAGILTNSVSLAIKKLIMDRFGLQQELG